MIKTQSNDRAQIPLSHDLTIIQQEQHYIHQATADNTRRAYQAAVRRYEAQGGKLPADEAAIAHYLTQQASLLKPNTLALHLTALSHWHQYQNQSDPTQSAYIRKLLKGIQREHGQPKRKAKALQATHIESMVAQLSQSSPQPNNLKAIRDSALIQIAYFGALRRSELIAIRVEHLQFEPEGLLILIPKSKTDTTGKGIIKALPYGIGSNAVCPVKAVKRWLDTAKMTEGLLFRAVNRWGQLQQEALHPDSINVIIKSLARECQFEFVDNLSSHSLRRGFATSAARAGADFTAIKRQGGWQNDHTVREYIEEGQCFEENAARTLLEAKFNNKAYDTEKLEPE